MKESSALRIYAVGAHSSGCGAAGAVPASTAPAAADEAKPVEEAPTAPDLAGEWKQSN